jgi:hypothetical protein
MRLSPDYGSDEIKRLADATGQEEAVSVLHGITSPFVMEYLGLVKSGRFPEAAGIGNTPDLPVLEMSKKLSGVYDMTTLATWIVDSAWPIVPDSSKVGFVYRIKADYNYTHYYLMTAVMLEGNRLYIERGISPEADWPESYRTPSVENPSGFGLGEVKVAPKAQ